MCLVALDCGSDKTNLTLHQSPLFVLTLGLAVSTNNQTHQTVTKPLEGERHL